MKFNKNSYYTVVKINDDGSLLLDTGLTVKFRGLKLTSMEKVKRYLKEYVLKKKIFLKFDKSYIASNDSVEAYVYLMKKRFEEYKSTQKESVNLNLREEGQLPS